MLKLAHCNMMSISPSVSEDRADLPQLTHLRLRLLQHASIARRGLSL
jgi:hypothetical protein